MGMSDNPSVAARRERLLQRLFPAGTPALWCPALTHYDEGGGIDEARMAAHLRHLARHVKGFLIPGSTGDGWELDAVERRQLLGIALRQAGALQLDLLIGALQAEAAEALGFIHETVNYIKSSWREPDTGRALARARVCGFTVCPPRGRELTQEEIGRGLVSLLETGLPLALYQLPQVTQNEIGPELAGELAAQFENFILFKDSSGADRVVLRAQSLHGVFTVRGAEGDYARALRTGGGSYDGLLLSTANCFAPQLGQMINDLGAGRVEADLEISDRLSAVVAEVFELVASLPQGNAFTNANKAMDHFFAWGSRARSVPPPRLHAGVCLPAEVIEATGAVLARHGLLPETGYLGSAQK
jgi:dihydrodipicolinate synthase/N-acetylneuraminate lyase